MVKILHAADIHLDSPFSKLTMEKSEIRRNELRGAFSSLMTYARTNDVDLILLAGDLFDSAFVTRETVYIMLREFEKLPQTKIVIAPGNHDPYTASGVYAKTDFPGNVYVFDSPELSRFSFDDLGVDVYGWAFTEEQMTTCPLTGKRPLRTDRLNLLCAHADMRSAISPYCPLTQHDLTAFGCDYAALGHVHNSDGIHAWTNGGREGYYGYSGCLEGRGFDETGPKGAYLIEAEGKRIQVHQLRFSKRRYETMEISVTGAHTQAEVEDRIAAAISEMHYGEDTLLRAVLRGAVAPTVVLSPAALAERFPLLFLLEIIDETTPTLDGEYLEHDMSVRGEFYRALLPVLTSGTEEERAVAAAALRYGLAALSGENIADRA